MQVLWTQDFPIRYSELDHRGALSMPSLCRLLQEAAGLHAERLGFATEQLEPLGLAWVLAKFQVRLTEETHLPRWRQVVKVETWRAGIERIFALRDYRMLDASGKTVAVGTSYWSLIDLARRKPVPFPPFVVESYPADAPRALATSYEKLPAVTHADYEASHVVRPSDLDANNHVNNVSYLIWALDTIPQTVAFECTPTEVELVFRAEALLGDSVTCGTQQLATPGDPVFVHSIKRLSDGRELAQARTRWAAPTFD